MPVVIVNGNTASLSLSLIFSRRVGKAPIWTKCCVPTSLYFTLNKGESSNPSRNRSISKFLRRFMLNGKKIVVVMPAYNAEKTLEKDL